jgi:hypothetical protein
MTDFEKINVRMCHLKVVVVVVVVVVKDKGKVVHALRLCTGRTSHRGIRVIALPFHVHGTRRG